MITDESAVHKTPNDTGIKNFHKTLIDTGIK